MADLAEKRRAARKIGPGGKIIGGLSKSKEVFYYINLGEFHSSRSVADSQSAAGKRRSSDMFKLVVLSGLLAVALAKPSVEVRPRNVAQVENAATIIAEKTIESHGHSIIHHTAPGPSVPLVAEGSPILPTVPLTVPENLQLPEKSEKLEASSEKLESSQEKIKAPSQEILEAILAKELSTPTKITQKVESSAEEKQLSDPQKSNEAKQGRQLIDLQAPEGFHYLVPYPLYPALTTPVVTPVVPKTLNLIEKPESRPASRTVFTYIDGTPGILLYR
ncbi:hypothetical protein M0804_004659 [Polistes exclamans]|nr:hypothetical protein M0804_004659 [Polistes exclamans]